MKPLEKTIKNLLTGLMIVALFTNMQAQNERLYFGVEINGVLCGYGTSDVNDIHYRGVQMRESHDTVNLLLKALGQDMDMQIISRNIFYPDNFQIAFNQTKFEYNTGNITESQTEIYEDYALRTEAPKTSADTIFDIAGVIFDNPLSAQHVINDFIKDTAKERTYRVYDYVRGYIADHIYTLVGEEEVYLAGQVYNALIINVYNTKDGTYTKTWVNKEDGMSLKFEVMNRTIFLADESVMKKIKIADLDNTMFAKVGKNIPNFMQMSYLKVSADIRTAGEEVSVESLNFPGQKFEGTVVENNIQGIFEIEPLRYNGDHAPLFPPEFEDGEFPQKYLKPEIFIESDQAEIIAEARAITAGSADSWEAAVRLSKWVGKEIHGAVPGGTTAIKTYRTREGECGSHSRLLTAFCRAVGIPSRLSIGCMYSPWYGGSFGQHAWTEVYMGKDVGWVAIDATILEYDYVDAGHIRLGEGANFHPKKMEILEYLIDGEESIDTGSNIPRDYVKLVGPYTNPRNRNVLEVQYADGGIGVDIMGRIILALKDPDEEGRRYAKLSDKIYFSFPENENGQVDEMIIVENVFAMKNLDTVIADDENIPENLQALLGPYLIPSLQKEFNVRWDSGQLCMLVPNAEVSNPLEKTDKDNRWRDPLDKKEYSFIIKDDGNVSGMEIYVTSVLNKGASTSWIIEKAIEKDGIEAAEAKFRELWDNRALDLENTERDLNNLGYKYLSAEQMDEALMVFKLNVEVYPQSWNVYDSYAEALAKNEEFEAAIINYQKSLELNPENENGKEALEGLLSMNKK